MNSAQRLQSETQSQAANGSSKASAQVGVDSATVPTQILPPTQRQSEVRQA